VPREKRVAGLRAQPPESAPVDWPLDHALAALTELRSLVGRLPGRATRAREAVGGGRPRLVVVQRRESMLAEQLRALAGPGVPVIWDRRDRDRRALAGPIPLDRRRRDRRSLPAATWTTLRFLVVLTTDSSG
jgi:hypothetical protein